MKLVKGENLTTAQRNEVLRAFIYRTYDKTIYPVQEKMIDPAQYDELCRNLDPVWLNARAFYIRKDGHLAQKPGHCESASHADSWNRLFDTESKR